MKSNPILALLLSLIILFPNAILANSAVNGILDLHTYNFQQQGPKVISGQFLFQWSGFTDAQSLPPTRSLRHVPDNWSSLNKDRSFFKQDFGFASYGLKIVLPDTSSSLAILIPPIPSAYRLFINGKLVSQLGNPSTDHREFIPSSRTNIVFIQAKEKEISLLLHVANYYFASSGIWSPITIGTTSDIVQLQQRMFLQDSFLVGCLLIMGLYHVAIFAMRKHEKGAFYFAILCLMLALRGCFSTSPLFFLFLPQADYKIAIQILYTTFPIILLGFFQFFRSISLINFSKLEIKISFLLIISYSIIVWTTPNYIHGRLLLFVIIWAGWIGLRSIVALIKVSRTKPLESLLLLFGILSCIAGLLNDSLYERGIVHTGFVLPFAFGVLVLMQAIVLALHFTGALTRAETLTQELQHSNIAYEQMVLRRRQAEEQREMESLKTRFLSNVTHEFKTPLALITAPTEFLMSQVQHNPEQQEMLRTIYRNSSHLLRLVNQLLDFSNLREGKMTTTYNLGNIKDFCAEITHSFQLLAKSRQLNLHFDSSQCKENIALFDADKVEKILNNLLSNAIKFTKAFGHVTVHVATQSQDEGHLLTIRVSDSGIGMTAEFLENLFERYYRNADPALNSTGTGLGLVHAKELVEILKGTISVESKPNKGSDFTITLPHSTLEDMTRQNPIRELPVLQSTIVEQDDQLATSEKNTLLIVEDNEELLNYLAGYFSGQYTIITSSDGNHAWQVIRAELPDVIISDIMMPGKDGYELTRLIRNSPLTSHIGVILLSAKLANGERLKGVDVGANDYLTKPVVLSELKQKVYNQLKYQQTLKAFYSKGGQSGNPLEAVDELKHPFMTKIYDILDQNLSESQLSITELADKMAVSKRTLNRKLNTLTYMSANELIRKYRLEKAAFFLSTGSTVSEAAYMSGFESVSYFGACFKEKYHCTPTEFLKKLRTDKR